MGSIYMAANDAQIEAFKQAALSQGYDPKEVEAFAAMARVSQTSKAAKEVEDVDKWVKAVNNGLDISSVPQDVRADVQNKLGTTSGYTPNFSQQPKPQVQASTTQKPQMSQEPTQNASSQSSQPQMSQQPAPQQDGIVKSLIKGIINPFVRTGKNIAGAGYEVYRAGKQALGDKNAYYNQEKGEVVQNPFLNEQELEKASKPLSLGKDSALRQQISDSASVVSTGVSFGKGAGIVQKALIPGAKVGAMNALRPGLDLEELPSEIAYGAVTGAAGAGLLHGAGSVLSKGKNAISKFGKETQKSGKEVEQSIRQMKVKPEVGGAQKEQLINKTLDDLGIKGSPQQQYKMLQPKMTQIEKDISVALEKSPLKFEPASIRDQIVTTLDDQGLLIGKKAKDAASQALDDVMDDVVVKGKEGGLSSLDLFKVKQKLNKIAQRVSDKMDRGIAVNENDEVLMAARDALDDIIGKYHADVKGMTMAQSRLFDSAKSLSSARSNPPVLRAAGFSVPAGVTIRSKQVVGSGMEKIGKFTSKIGDILPSMSESRIPALSNLGSRLGVNDLEQQSQQIQGNLNNQTSYEESNQQVNNEQDHAGIIPQETLNPYGATPEELYSEYQNAFLAGDKKTADFLYQMYKDEAKYQSEAKKTTGKGNVTASIDIMENLYGSGTDSSLSMGENTVGIAGLGARGNVIYKKLNDQEYSDKLNIYKTQMALVAGAINQAAGAGVLNGGEYERLAMDSFPNEFTSEAVARAWFTNARKVLESLPSDRASLLNDILSGSQSSVSEGEGGGMGGGAGVGDISSDNPVLEEIERIALESDIGDQINNPQIIAEAARVLMKSEQSISSDSGRKIVSNFFKSVKQAIDNKSKEKVSSKEKEAIGLIVGGVENNDTPGLDIGGGNPKQHHLYR